MPRRTTWDGHKDLFKALRVRLEVSSVPDQLVDYDDGWSWRGRAPGFPGCANCAGAPISHYRESDDVNPPRVAQS